MDGEGNMQADGGMTAVDPQPLGGEAPAAADFTNLQRVKVYRLNESGHWDDKGTGHVSCEYMEVRCRHLKQSARADRGRNRL